MSLEDAIANPPEGYEPLDNWTYECLSCHVVFTVHTEEHEPRSVTCPNGHKMSVSEGIWYSPYILLGTGDV